MGEPIDSFCGIVVGKGGHYVSFHLNRFEVAVARYEEHCHMLAPIIFAGLWQDLKDGEPRMVLSRHFMEPSSP